MTFDLTSLIAFVHDSTGRGVALREVEVGDRGDMWVARLAADLMAYVPKTEAVAQRLARERRVLTRVAARVSFRLPRPVGKDGPFDLREPVPGVSGSVHYAPIFADAARRARVLLWMRDVLDDLHAALTVTELDAFGVERPAWSEGVAPSAPDVLLHGDFGVHNVAFDARTGQPSGVFDFHDLARGPRAIDFRWFAQQGDEGLAFVPKEIPAEDLHRACIQSPA